jgi:hypothetical protein
MAIDDVLQDLRMHIASCTRRVLHDLRNRNGPPRFGRPTYGHIDWKWSQRQRELLIRAPSRKVWLDYYDEDLLAENSPYIEGGEFRLALNWLHEQQEISRSLAIYWGLTYDDIPLNSERSLALTVEFSFLRPLIELTAAYRWDDDKFDNLFSTFGAKLRQARLRRLQYAALRHFYSTPMQLEGGWQVRTLSEMEISEAAPLGVLPLRRLSSRSATLDSNQLYVLVKDEELSIGPADFDDPALYRRAMKLASYSYPGESARLAVELINLSSSSKHAAGLGHEWCVHETGAGRAVRRDDLLVPFHARHVWDTCRLTKSEGEEFRTAWSRFRRAKRDSAIRTAISRLSTGIGRPDPRDGIIDLAIAAESLFGDRTKGESSYRIALNAALWIDDPRKRASEVRRFFAEVYNTRSRIVHGSITAASDAAALEEVRHELATLLRAAIRKVAHSSGGIPNWASRLDDSLDAFREAASGGAGSNAAL